MNLSKFLKETDTIAAAMSQDQLTGFIHDIARTLPEKDRDDFLTRLRETHEKKEPAQNLHSHSKDFSKQYQSIKAKLELIESWELCLVGSLNEEYDDWYDSDSEEFIYEDPNGVTDIIEEACRFLHQCVDCEEYKAACEIARILVTLDIMVGGDYQDYADEPLNISELSWHHLGNIDYKALVIDALHGAYCANKLTERAKALYEIIKSSGRNDITLEMVMQNGRELPDIEQFLPLWIAYLGNLTGANAERLLKEAFELSGDSEQLLVSARRYHDTHPELYEQYILNIQANKDDKTLLAIGEEALKTIRTRYLVRSRIALCMSRAALRCDMGEEAERYWLEAFRSDTRVVNYLRLLMECKDFSQVREKARSIYHSLYPQLAENRYGYSAYEGQKENLVSPSNTYMLAFLGGEFQFVKEHGMNVKGSLGWSDTFMKCGMAAFLLLFMEDAVLGVGGSSMCDIVVSSIGFDKTDYEKGILKAIGGSSEEFFWKCWSYWKKTISFSGEEKRRYLDWIKGLLTMRVKGIMEGNHRKYYGECAEYIAALGEAVESTGVVNGKQILMMEYKDMYSRRSAFHRELRQYGMKDTRKR